MMIRSFLIRLLLVFGFAPMLVPASLADQQYADGMVRAAVIFGLLRFTEWPPDEVPVESIRLCSLGSSPAIEAIQSLNKLPSIGNRQVRYHAIEAGQQLEACHVMLLGTQAKMVDALPRAVLLICDDCDDTYGQLWMINLMRIEDRIQFEVNLDQVVEKELSLGASLLELAARCSSRQKKIRGCDG